MLAILRNPLLYTEPLYGSKCGESKESSELETFCKAMGWTEVDGVLRKKPEVENHNGWKVENLIDVENVHGDWAKANVKHEMRTSQTKGIEKLRSIEKLTDRKAAELRRVIVFFHSVSAQPTRDENSTAETVSGAVDGDRPTHPPSLIRRSTR